MVALFFACDGHHDKDGRVILQKADEIQGMIKYPRNPRHRVAGQKSVFVRHPKGFIEPHKDNIVIIPASLKKLTTSTSTKVPWYFYGNYLQRRVRIY